MKLIRIHTIYKEDFLCKLSYKNRYYFFTDKGCIPTSEIEYYEVIGDCFYVNVNNR